MQRLTETDTGLTDFLYSYCFIGVVAILKHLPERIMASITLPQLDCILQIFFDDSLWRRCLLLNVYLLTLNTLL